MNKKYIILPVLTLACLFATSCDSLLDTKSKHLLPAELVQSESGCESMLLGVYDLMQEVTYYGRDMLAIPEILADNTKLSPVATRYKDIADNKVGAHLDIWEESYEMITLLNEVLMYVEKLPETPKSKALKGEALTLRALCYMNLTITYGREPNYLVNDFNLSVPLIKDAFFYSGGALGEDVFPRRATVAEIWKFIEEDLTAAFPLLEGNDGGLMPKRAGALANKAIQSRVYLFQEKWNECKEASTYVIDNGNLPVYNGNYTKVFSEDRESIFYLFYTAAEALGSSSLHSTYGMRDSEVDEDGYDIGKGSGDGTFTIPDDLMTLYDQEADTRFAAFRKARISGTEVWWSRKFNSWQGEFGQDNIPVIRISEIVLNRAEALAELKEFDAARADVNTLRNARGLSEAEASDNTLLTEILLQRRLELAFEGFRFFDLKRRGQTITKPDGKPSIPYTDFRVVSRITDVQMDANPNLVNNPGY